MKRLFTALITGLFLAVSAHAADLTPAQRTAFKAALWSETDAALVSYRSNGQTTMIKAWYELPATPDFIVWKSSVTQDEIMQNGFDWTQVDNTTVGKARIWEWLFASESRAINPSKANIRAGIAEAWKGTSAMLAVRAAIYTHCKRAASRIEKLLAAGTGTDADPATMAFEGAIPESEIALAMEQ